MHQETRADLKKSEGEYLGIGSPYVSDGLRNTALNARLVRPTMVGAAQAKQAFLSLEVRVAAVMPRFTPRTCKYYR